MLPSEVRVGPDNFFHSSARSVTLRAFGHGHDMRIRIYHFAQCVRGLRRRSGALAGWALIFEHLLLGCRVVGGVKSIFSDVDYHSRRGAAHPRARQLIDACVVNFSVLCASLFSAHFDGQRCWE